MRRGEVGWSVHARLIAASAALLLLPLLLPLLSGRVFTRDDFGALHLPFRFLYQEALRAGHLLLWTPAYHTGFFFFGAGETGMAHPWHAALYRFLPLGPAFNIEIAANYVALFAGVTLLWRRLGLSREGALMAAMLYAFSGFALFNAMHVNHITTLAHAPWMLLATHVLVTTNSPHTRAFAFAGLSIATGLQLLGGNPQYVWLTGIAVLALLLWLKSEGAAVRPMALVVAALFCGGLIGAVQLLPTLDFLRDSTRANWTGDAALSFSLEPLNVLQLWSPFAFEFRVAAPPGEQFIVHEFVVYNGAFTTAALVWAATNYRRMPQRRLLAALFLFAGVNLILAFGRYGGLYPILAELPGLRSLRAPSRHLLLVHLATSGIAGLVLQDLLSRAHERRVEAWKSLWPLAMLIVVSVATTIAASALAGGAWAANHELRFSGLLRAAPSTAIVIAIVITVMLAARGHRQALHVLIVATALDLGLWGYSYILRYNPVESIEQLKAEATAPPDGKAGDVIKTYVGGRDAYAILRGMRLTLGYTGLYAAQVLNPRAPETERLAGLTWNGDGERWQRVDDPLPRARLLTEAIVTNDPRSRLSEIDSRTVAFVDHTVTVAGPVGLVTLMEERPGRFVVRTATPAPQILAFTERFHRGWTTTIDGHPAETIRLYGDFLGCVVPAGDHDVTVEFDPLSVRVGGWLGGVGLLSTLFVAMVLSRREFSESRSQARTSSSSPSSGNP